MSVYKQKDKEKAVHKSVAPDLSAPKRKHVRKIIVDSWQYGRINFMRELMKEPLLERGVVAFKGLTVTHKLLQEGAPRVLKQSYSWLTCIYRIEEHWARARDPQYSNPIAHYGHFLRSKITFHHKHPLVLGSLALDDYKRKIKNQPEVPLQYRLQMLSHLLDLHDAILRAANAVLAYRPPNLHEAKVAALVPLVVESDAVYQITVHHMYLICDRVETLEALCGLLERFNGQYDAIRQMYDGARRIKYVSDLITVPTLTPDAQSFQATANLVHLVPEDDGPQSVVPLMDVERYMAETASAPPPENPDARPPSTSYERGVTAAQLEQMRIQEEERAEQEKRAAQLKEEHEKRQQEQMKLQQMQQQQLLAAQQQQQAMMNQMPPEMRARHAQLTEEARRMTPEEVATHVMKMQNDQMAYTHMLQHTNGALQHAQQRIMELERLLMERDAEILHWKQLHEQVSVERDRYLRMLGDETNRANELEEQLLDVNRRWNEEKKKNLDKKLAAASAHMSIALQLLQDDEAGDPHASPQSVIALCSRLDERLNGVKDHASQHNTDGMAEEIEHMTQTMQQQCRQAKGVAQFLTDDPSIRDAIQSATEKTADATHGVVKTVSSDPHDTDVIHETCNAALRLNEEVKRAMERVVAAETCHDEDALSAKASDELSRAADIIAQATQTLLEAKEKADKELAERKKKNPSDALDLNVSGPILDATMAIAQATANLMTQARAMQKETAGRTAAGGKAYKKDLRWTEGLVTAANGVAGTVSELIQRANHAVTSDELEEEELIASTKAVSAATTQLVLASRVRAAPNSDTQKSLERASSSVTRGTRNLVHAAQAASSANRLLQEDDEDDDVLSGQRMTTAKVQQMEQQVHILKLEKELETARRRLGRLREAQYE